MLEDPHDDTLVVSELKWVRPPIGWKSRHRANNELQHGAEQLRQIREFLLAHPDYLAARRGGISKPISQFKNLYHAVLTRGHLIHVEPKSSESMIPLDAFKHALKSEGHLAAAMEWLLSDSWLPKEGVDFKIQNSHFRHQGYLIEAPVFIPS